MHTARSVGLNASVDSRCLVAPVCSPHHIPDLSSINAGPNCGHFLTDATTTLAYVTKGTAAAAQILGASVAAMGAEAAKRRVYGNVAPHRAAPLVSEEFECGAPGKE